jgi:predicted transcriptional regulator
MDTKNKASVVISVTLRQGMLDQLNKIASRFDVNINRLIGNFISCGLDHLKVLKRYGILKKIFFIQNLLKQYGIDVKKIAEDKVKHQRTVSMSVRISEEISEGLEQWATELKRPKSSIIESCIGMTIDLVVAVDVGGLLKAGVGFSRVVERIEEFIQDKGKVLKMWKREAQRAQRISEKMLDIGT